MILNTSRDVRLQDGSKILRGKTAEELKRLCRSFRVESCIKKAAIGGEQEAGFEQSFASLAYSHIQDKAPGLIDYLVGFQLVDRNNENTKAVGIFGFKIGQNWVYAPVFFLNGDLKGHELLYLKAQDSFVPMKENWINYIINKRPHVLGESSNESMEQLGIQQPDIQQLSKPPLTGKFASIKDWAKPVMPKYAQWATQNPQRRDPELTGRLDLAEFLKQDVRFCKIAIELAEVYPGVKKGFDRFYGPGVLRDALLHLRKQAEQSRPNVLQKKVASTTHKRLRSVLLTKQAAGPPPSSKLEVVPDTVITENTPKMTEQEQEKLLRDGYLIRDHRNGDEVSVVYNTQVDMSLANPDNTCVTDILVKPGTFERCLVVMNPHGGGRWKDDFSAVVRLGDKKNWANYHSTDLFVRQENQSVKSDVSEWRSWFNTLDSSKSLSKGSTYIIVTEDGQGSCVFRVEQDLGDGCYEVTWEDYCSRPPDRIDDRPVLLRPSGPVGESCDTVTFNEREGSRFRVVNGKLYCPPESRVIRIADPPECSKCGRPEDECCCDYFRSTRPRDRDPIRPGNLADLQLMLTQKQADAILSRTRSAATAASDSTTAAHNPAGTSAGNTSGVGLSKSAANAAVGQLKIWTDGNEAVVNNARMTKLAALFHLVRDHGLREGVAKKLLKEAQFGKTTRWIVKYANPMMQGLIGPYATGEGGPSMPMQGMDPSMSMNPAYGGVATQEGTPGDYMPVPGMGYDPMAEQMQDPMQNIDPAAMQMAQQAAGQGQKEIFDTAMIGSMLKAVRQDSLVDRYLGDLLKALDRLGRILFMFYWHNEEFMDRYGKQDLPELEDTLRNAFETLGDLALFLKQKTVDPFGGAEQMGEPELAEAAG